MIKHNDKILSQEKASKLMKKLQLKYGIELQEIRAKAESEKKCWGFISPETEAKQEDLINRIKKAEGLKEDVF